MKIFRKKTIIVLLVLIVVAVIGYAYSKNKKKPVANFVIVQQADIVQKVSVTGRVKPSQSVDLAFEKTGKISRADLDVGDKVKIGDQLVALENSDLQAQLKQAQAGLENSKAQMEQYQAALETQEIKLEEMKSGTRTEEIKITETKVLNAEKSLANAEINLNNVEEKAQADIQGVIDGALTSASKAISTGTNALFTITDIQYAHFATNEPAGISIAQAKAAAIYALLGVQNAGLFNNAGISELQGGTKETLTRTQLNPTEANIISLLAEVKAALEKVKTALNTITILDSFSATELTNLSTHKTNIDNEIIAISGKEQTIEIQKVTNRNAISSAESAVTETKNVLASLEDELALKKAGSREEQIRAQRAQIKQAQANVVSGQAQIKQAEASIDNIKSQIEKTVIRSPIEGIITKQEAKVGEIVSANQIIVSLISISKYEIEADVPEADIAKLKTGDNAEVTLDAYGLDLVFEAKVVKINPAETIIEGVATYKTTFQFLQEDEKIKSGMTANIDILTAKREGAIIVPQRAIIAENGEKFVRIQQGDVVKEVKVVVGIRGSDGNIEIIEGVKEGDRLIISN